MRALFRMLRKSRIRYEPLITVSIFADILKKNYEAFQYAYPAVSFAPVLKSNAYGHGMVEVARVFDEMGAPFFVVDSYVEALILRNEKIKTPILIIGYTLPENILLNRLRNIAFTVGNIDDLLVLANTAEHPTAIHLKIDSGMHRQGMAPEDVSKALEVFKRSKTLRLEGIGTHLADADGENTAATTAQIAQWNAIVHDVCSAFPECRYVHCAATEGSKFSSTITANIARLGIGLYGCTTTSGVSIAPALEMKTIITSVRRVRKGESIGYNYTYTAPRDMRVATVPVGYAEGVDRRLSNKGFLGIRNSPCPIVGRVSMNITSIDVTDFDPPLALREEVVVISKERASKNSCESMARQCDTIPYEILVHIPSTLRRNVR